MEKAPVSFRVRWDRVDQQLLAAAKRHQHQGTLADAEAREGLGAVLLAEIVEPGESPGDHFAEETRLFWWFVYRLFVGDAVEHPPSFQAKAVLMADVYVPPIAWGGTAYLSVWAGVDGPELGQPVLVPFPRVPDVLMRGDVQASFADSCRAYRAPVADAVDRVNLVAPAALALAHQAAAASG